MHVRSTKKQAAKSAKKATKAAVKTSAQKKKSESEFFTAINSLEIKQFKSIRHMKIDCKHINLFIGQPNVGKSNVLEAMALLAPQFVSERENFFSEFIRYEEFADLFHNMPGKDDIEIIIDDLFANISYQTRTNDFNYFWGDHAFLPLEERNNLKSSVVYNGPPSSSPVYHYDRIEANGKSSYQENHSFYRGRRFTELKKYQFATVEKYNFYFQNFLATPNGSNFYGIARENDTLQQIMADTLSHYNLELVFEQRSPQIKVQTKKGRLVSSLPYSGIADTLQRYFFHLAAILSNDKSVILFEEPETHSHPAYIRRLAEQIADCKNNQFFITTHSPYVLNILLERKELIDHLNVFVLEYQNHETVARKLTDKEIVEFLNYGSSIFFKI